MPDQAPQIASIIVKDGRLYAVNGEGQELPIYVFGPLMDYPKGLTVPFIDDWEPTLINFVNLYFPIPLPSKEKLPKAQEAPNRFWSRTRNDEGNRRPWVQAVYGGFPLYLYGDGTKNETPDPTGQPLFRPASIQLVDGPSIEHPGVPAGYGP